MNKEEYIKIGDLVYVPAGVSVYTHTGPLRFVNLPEPAQCLVTDLDLVAGAAQILYQGQTVWVHKSDVYLRNETNKKMLIL